MSQFFFICNLSPSFIHTNSETEDYAPVLTAMAVTFAAGAFQFSLPPAPAIPVTIVNDNITESEEQFILTLQPLPGAPLFTLDPSRLVITILDDDGK